MAAPIDDLSRSLMREVRPSAVSAAGWRPVERWRGAPHRLRRGKALQDRPGAGRPPSPGNPPEGLCHR
jgi:hypothetical protein